MPLSRLLGLIGGLAAAWVAGALLVAWLGFGGGERRPLPPSAAVGESPLSRPAASERSRRPLPAASVNDPLLLVDTEDLAPGMVSTGTAFAVGAGLWLTARHVANPDCRQLSVRIDGGKSYPALIRYLHPEADLAVLESRFAVEPLAIAVADPDEDDLGYSFGYPIGVLGATSDRLLGRSRMRLTGRLQGTASALVWAEEARFPETLETVRGMSGGPMFDADGRVVGIFAATSSRRGRNYTVAPETIRTAGRQVSAPLAPGPRATPAFERTPALPAVAGALAKSGRIARVFCDP
ncbi:MAG: serine protease [Bauldia sp.]